MASSAKHGAGKAFRITRLAASQGQPTSSRELFWRRRNFWFGFVLDGEQLHFKNERRAGANARTRVRSAISISEVRGNKELPLRSYRHELQSLGPAFNDSRHRKCLRMATLVGTIELRAVKKSATVVA